MTKHVPQLALILLLISSVLATPAPENGTGVLELTNLPEGCREPYPFKGCGARVAWGFEACGVYRGEACGAFCRGLVPGAPPCQRASRWRWRWRGMLGDQLYAHCMRSCLQLGQAAADSCTNAECFAQRPEYATGEGALIYLAATRGLRVRSHSAPFRLPRNERSSTRVNCFFVCWRRARCPRACRRESCCRRRF